MSEVGFYCWSHILDEKNYAVYGQFQVQSYAVENIWLTIGKNKDY